MKVFTPYEDKTWKKLSFPIKDVRILEGDVGFRGLGLQGTVKIYGEIYKVYGASCGSPGCQCGARLKPYQPTKKQLAYWGISPN